MEEAAAAAGCPHCTQKFLETNLPQHHTSTAAADPPHVLQNLSPIIIYDIVVNLFCCYIIVVKIDVNLIINFVLDKVYLKSQIKHLFIFLKHNKI